MAVPLAPDQDSNMSALKFPSRSSTLTTTFKLKKWKDYNAFNTTAGETLGGLFSLSFKW